VGESFSQHNNRYYSASGIPEIYQKLVASSKFCVEHFEIACDSADGIDLYSQLQRKAEREIALEQFYDEAVREIFGARSVNASEKMILLICSCAGVNWTS
jgi:hypothetical protein